MKGAQVLGAPAKVVGHIATSIRTWPVRAQQAARRNAMIAATAATARRAERDDVAAYLRAHDGDATPVDDDVPSRRAR